MADVFEKICVSHYSGRLPFKPLPTKDAQTVLPVAPLDANGKKRKLSGSAGSSKAKCAKLDENAPKSNNVRKVEAGDNEVSSSSETLEQVVNSWTHSLLVVF